MQGRARQKVLDLFWNRSQICKIYGKGGPAQQRAVGVNHPTEIAVAGERICRGRKLHSIEPAEIAKSFRRIREPEQKKGARNSEQYQFAVNTNCTR